MSVSIQDLFNRLPGSFVPEKAANIQARVLFHLTGEKGGDWVVSIQDGTCVVTSGSENDPSLTFTAEAQDCLDIFYRKLDPTRAFMLGKVRLQGDWSLAMRLTDLFKIEDF